MLLSGKLWWKNLKQIQVVSKERFPCRHIACQPREFQSRLVLLPLSSCLRSDGPKPQCWSCFHNFWKVFLLSCDGTCFISCSWLEPFALSGRLGARNGPPIFSHLVHWSDLISFVAFCGLGTSWQQLQLLLIGFPFVDFPILLTTIGSYPRFRWNVTRSGCGFGLGARSSRLNLHQRFPHRSTWFKNLIFGYGVSGAFSLTRVR